MTGLVRKTVQYVIDGNLDGKGWVTYATLGSVPEQQAREVYAGWQKNRDASDWEIKYRLVRRTTENEVVLSEVSEDE